jgi:hypothetical protein
VIAHRAARLLDWHAGRRRRELEKVWRRAPEIQERALLSLVAAARDTEFGLAHGFGSIRSVADYQARVPVREYRDFAPFLERALEGGRSVSWPGRTREWIKTSGTTSGPKMIPMTREAFAALRKASWDTFLLAVERVGARRLIEGPSLLVGASSAAQPIGRGCRISDLSGLAVRRLPAGIRGVYSLGPEVSRIADWETRMDAVASLAAWEDLRLIAGVPSWLPSFFERVAWQRSADGRRRLRDLSECWRNLSVLIHGGVAFAPYAGIIEEWIGRRLERIEVYPAAEAFVGVETEAIGGLTLMLDHGVFFEFVPLEDLSSARPRRHTVADLELGRPYAVVATTAAGLWSYVLGDAVTFTKRDPLRFRISGRTLHYANISGENVSVEQVERALVGACRRTEADVVEFTVAPCRSCAEDPRPGHEWLVEFRNPPTEPDDFTRILDETLSALNGEYRNQRGTGVGMAPPRVTALPSGSFYCWMRECGKLGDCHKVPRVTNDRVLAEALLGTARELEPLATGTTWR